MGRCYYRFSLQICQFHQLLLDNRYRFDGYFDAQVTPCDHDAVSGFDDFINVQEGIRAFDLGDDERIMSQCGCGRTDCTDVLRAIYEGLTDGVNTMFQGKFHTGYIMVGKGINAEIDARQVQAFAGTEFTTHHHAALNILSLYPQSLQLDQSII
jgi:hypothetical protein